MFQHYAMSSYALACALLKVRPPSLKLLGRQPWRLTPAVALDRDMNARERRLGSMNSGMTCSEGGMIRLETLIELKLVNSSLSSLISR